MSEAYKADPRFADTPNLSSVRLWIILGLAFVSTFFLIRKLTAVPSVGSQADYDWVLTDLEGKPVKLSAYAGRPIFLNVWATWCGPCRQEMPSIARLATNPKLLKVAFLCVSAETPEDVKPYVASNSPPMTMLIADGAVPKVFRTNAIPATFLIAPDGRIVRAETGSNEWDQPEVVTLLEELAREAK